MLTGYGGGYQYGPVTTAAPQQPQQQRNTGDELVAELMQATQGVRLVYIYPMLPSSTGARAACLP